MRLKHDWQVESRVLVGSEAVGVGGAAGVWAEQRCLIPSEAGIIIGRELQVVQPKRPAVCEPETERRRGGGTDEGKIKVRRRRSELNCRDARPNATYTTRNQGPRTDSVPA